jgi:hypothetical protein
VRGLRQISGSRVDQTPANMICVDFYDAVSYFCLYRHDVQTTERALWGAWITFVSEIWQRPRRWRCVCVKRPRRWRCVKRPWRWPCVEHHKGAFVPSLNPWLSTRSGLTRQGLDVLSTADVEGRPVRHPHARGTHHLSSVRWQRAHLDDARGWLMLRQEHGLCWQELAKAADLGAPC